jgi:acyl-CoA reductase-like NAD-dependent aldehyde dehydrogenase
MKSRGQAVEWKGMIPGNIPNWINGLESTAVAGETFPKINPHNGKGLYTVSRSKTEEVMQAVAAAKDVQASWAAVPPVQRGMLLHAIVRRMEERQVDIARIVALETGKCYKDALGETKGAIALGLFYASEGQRLYGRTTTSGMQNRQAMTVRQPVGLAGLIVPANTPIANVAWKVFPALVCGNAAILKPAEDTPATAWVFAQIAHEAGLPAGVLNVIQGYGDEAGIPLVDHPDVGVISFTGSTRVGRMIQQKGGERLARVSLELGGKNPLVVCDDADMENAVKWAVLSAFSNAGQRCASASRIIVFDAVYDEFRDLMLARTQGLKVGPTDADDFGPVINARQLDNMLGAVTRAVQQGATLLTGGGRLADPAHRDGFYMAPTILENVDPHDEISMVELFGPITCLYRVKDFAAALALANDSPYGLTACIHTTNLHRAMVFTEKVEAGVVIVNAGTYGSEPHMPFGGVKQSGNGWREPGTEALDIYSNLKDVYINIIPEKI